MAPGELPNWHRILLLVLTFFSFLPQIRLLWARKDSSGLSLYYVLFNLVVATELFTISFFKIVNCRAEKADFFIHSPPDDGDIINLVQFTLVWVLWLVIFIMTLVRRSDRDIRRRVDVCTLYLAFLLISVVPIFIDVATTNPYRDPYHNWATDGFAGGHIFYVNPIVDLFGLAALYSQARLIWKRPPGSGPGALSTVGCGVQALAFAVLALAWLWRLPFSWEGHIGSWPGMAGIWFTLVGFVSFDYAVFAVVQLALLRIVRRRMVHREDALPVGAPVDETAPLLGS